MAEVKSVGLEEHALNHRDELLQKTFLEFLVIKIPT